MASLETLKDALRQQATKKPLSDSEYTTGFDVLLRGSNAYEDFVIPALIQEIASLLDSRSRISVLEIGPGPKSILENLPSHMRNQIGSYTAYEPNALFALNLEERLSASEEPPLPSLESSPLVHRAPFPSDTTRDDRQSHDVIIFCHSLYGNHPHHAFVEKALGLLNQELESSLVVVFHRHGSLDLGELVSNKTAVFPTGIIRVPDEDEKLDLFVSFITGFSTRDSIKGEIFRAERRKVCRSLGRRDEPNELIFAAPEVMMTFNNYASTLPELTAVVPRLNKDIPIKNRQARLHRPAAIVRPTKIEHIQHCVRWALKYNLSLTVLSGGHSGNCAWPGVVAIDMGGFNKIHVLSPEENKAIADSDRFVLVESGCKIGDVVGATMKAGLTVPLGSRPSVGAGLWLQGGIGHLSRLYGLACDAIVGAVLVSVESGQVLSVGKVPLAHRPTGAVCLDNEADETALLWAIKGAGTNFGIVVSVVFKTFEAQKFHVRHYLNTTTNGDYHTQSSRQNTLDTYIFWNAGQLQISATAFECFADSHVRTLLNSTTNLAFGQEACCSVVDNVGLFETESYIPAAHSVQAGIKTSSFKRCVFFKEDPVNIDKRLLATLKPPPSEMCYIHVLCGGGAIGDVAPNATAFGCRRLGCALVITGVWPRDQDGTEAADAAIGWVYKVVEDLLPQSIGVYGADLGPDPRDAILATRAFGQNLARLIRLKRKFDPQNVLAYACPLKASSEPNIIIMVTGIHGVGKDFCGELWALQLRRKYSSVGLRVRVVSISGETKKAYAMASGADLQLLLCNRDYKELHRPELNAFFHDQLKNNPRLREEHFQNIVRNANTDVLFVTGMRDEAPVATFSHLATHSRVFNIRVEASEDTLCRRRGAGHNELSCFKSLSYRPDFIFQNNSDGDESAFIFAERYLFPLFDEDSERLAKMIRRVSDFPRQEVSFRHVLDISQQPKGLALCASLLQRHYADGWDKVGAIVCCEAGSFVFGGAFALTVDKPLALIRKEGKLPPPTVSVVKSSSHISSSLESSKVDKIEIGQEVIPKGVPVVVLDDVLATGETLCAILELLVKAGIDMEDVTVMTVVEFPYHRGRYLLHERGFGKAKIQSLLVFGGA